MPNYSEIGIEINSLVSEKLQEFRQRPEITAEAVDQYISTAISESCTEIRDKYLKKFSSICGDRNVVAYYSSFVQFNIDRPFIQVCPDDITGFMANLHNLTPGKGLDLILHTPGGDIAAAERIIGYLRKKFENDIRVFVPELAASAGTLIALSAKQIFMTKHSALTPVDPQFGPYSALNVITEFEQAIQSITNNPNTSIFWANFLGRYPMGFDQRCRESLRWVTDILGKILPNGMFNGDPEASTKTTAIKEKFTSAESVKNHARPIDIDEARDCGVNVIPVEENQDLQEILLSLHHAFTWTFSLFEKPPIKIIQNNHGAFFGRH